MRNVMLDGALCAGRAAAMAELETQLGLPEWWGRNLDALHDCLWECGEVRFVVKNHQALLDTPFGRGLWQVLADGAAENPRLQVAAARKVRLRGRLRPQAGKKASG